MSADSCVVVTGKEGMAHRARDEQPDGEPWQHDDALAVLAKQHGEPADDVADVADAVERCSVL